MTAATKRDHAAYEFKFRPEMLWFVAVTVIVTVMLHLTAFEPEGVSDWHAWAVGIGAAAVRAFAGAMIAVLTSTHESWLDALRQLGRSS